MRAEGAPLVGGGSAGLRRPLDLIHRNKVPNPISMRLPAALEGLWILRVLRGIYGTK